MIDIESLTPCQIVAELDKYIVGQHNAKRSVSIALRNRWRRQQVPEHLRDEIAPKNIIMIGPTGVGKTEIARRLAKLTQSPFLKIEASKFTEVGYVGRDVESMIRDLTELAINIVKGEEREKVRVKASEIAEEKLLDILLPSGREGSDTGAVDVVSPAPRSAPDTSETREKFRKLLKSGRLNDRYVDLEVSQKAAPVVEVFSAAGMEEMDINLREVFGNLFPKKTKKRKVKVPEAMEILTQDESQRLIDMEAVTEQALKRVEQAGIVFLDEIDKIASRESAHGPDVSRLGVQRDLLPIVEGTTVNTKYGMVKTDHILFIASGAFHMSKPSDLIPELQGRFPIRVELSALGKDDFVRILTEPQNALIRQYQALMETEKLDLKFEQSAIEEVASIAALVNERTENIGARRLHTVMERLLDDISFNAPDMQNMSFTITAGYVRDKLSEIIKDEDLSRFIL